MLAKHRTSSNERVSLSREGGRGSDTQCCTRAHCKATTKTIAAYAHVGGCGGRPVGGGVESETNAVCRSQWCPLTRTQRVLGHNRLGHRGNAGHRATTGQGRGVHDAQHVVNKQFSQHDEGILRGTKVCSVYRNTNRYLPHDGTGCQRRARKHRAVHTHTRLHLHSQNKNPNKAHSSAH